MSLPLRLVLFFGALLVVVTILSYIRKRKIMMSDATGWVVIAALLLVIALFPGLVMPLSRALGFQSPANFVFLVVTGLLTIKTFRDSARISLMRHKIEELTQTVALLEDDSNRNDSA